MTSVSSSKLAGLTSTISKHGSKAIAISSRHKSRGTSKCTLRTEGFICNFEIPQVDTKIVRGDKCFTVAVNRYAVNVISVRVGIYSFGGGLRLCRHVLCFGDCENGRAARASNLTVRCAVSVKRCGGCDVLRAGGRCLDVLFDLFVVHFPKLYRFI